MSAPTTGRAQDVESIVLNNVQAQVNAGVAVFTPALEVPRDGSVLFQVRSSVATTWSVTVIRDGAAVVTALLFGGVAVAGGQWWEDTFPAKRGDLVNIVPTSPATVTVMAMYRETFDVAEPSTVTATIAALVTDTDDDSVAAAQVLPLFIGEGYRFDGTNWRRSQSRIASGTISETLMYDLVRAAMTGFDSTQAVGSQNNAIAARNADLIGDFDFSLVGMLTNSRLALLDISTSNWQSWSLDQLSVIEGAGRAPASIFGGWCLGVNFGRDTTVGTVYRPVEARNLDANGDVVSTLVGLLTNSRITALGAVDYERLSGRDANADGDFVDTLFGLITNARLGILDDRTGAYMRWRGITPNATSDLSEAALVTQARESAFTATVQGRRFTVTHQTIGTFVTGQTGFVDTTPTFMLRLSGPATKKDIFRSLSLSQANTPGGFVTIAVVLDTADRFSAGGTLVTPQNLNEESATAAVSTFRFNPTATAAGAGTRVIATVTAPASVGATTEIDFEDGIFMGTVSTLLVYTFAATTAPQWAFDFEFEEVTA